MNDAVSIVTCTNLYVSFGEDVILDHIDLAIEKNERLCVTGRNGSGKSTLLRLLAGEAEPDDGTIWYQEGLRVSALPQTLPERSQKTIFDVVAEAFAETGSLLQQYHQLATSPDPDMNLMDRLQQQIERNDGWNIDHRIMATIDRLGLIPSETLMHLSGGWLRRVAIARSLAADPDLWLLDEPTNHLDIPAIQWLEGVISDFQGTAMVISHDRRLLDRVASAVVDIDRGRVTRWDVGYQRFLERRTHELEVEERNAKLEDARLAEEEAWIREGVKARRTRNEGRVRALMDMREERKKRRERETLNMEIDAARKSGRIVKELEHISKSFDDQRILNDLDLVIQRGDRIGLMGPNGTGKTTLIRTILGEEVPDDGHVKTGTKLEVAYFDQSREQLDPEASVIDCVAEGRDFITINGRSVHIITYLSNFMFSKDKARSAVRVLSGGEQNRLLLAKLFMKSSNFMVLDEPTNDLDVETLEMLEELLHTYDGTVLVITHDRAFLDNVVGSMLVFEGDGVITEHVGGYTDWEARGGRFRDTSPATSLAEPKAVNKPQRRKGSSNRERERAQELTNLPNRIEELETNISTLHEQMADPNFYNQSKEYQQSTQDHLKILESDLSALFARWEELETDREP